MIVAPVGASFKTSAVQNLLAQLSERPKRPTALNVLPATLTAGYFMLSALAWPAVLGASARLLHCRNSAACATAAPPWHLLLLLLHRQRQLPSRVCCVQ
jgi:hypothetical protein